MNLSKRHLPNLIFLPLIFLFFTSCGNEKAPAGAAHQEAMQMTEAMILSHNGMLSKLDFMKKENRELSEKMNELEAPDSFLVATVLQTKAIIAQYEEIADAQEKLIEQNKNLMDGHGEKKLTLEEIKAQHKQIEMNYETVQKQAASILQDLENMKNKHTAVEPEK